MSAKRPASLPPAKAILRDRVRRLRRGWDETWVFANSTIIQARLIDLPEFQQARHVGCYLARPGEVRTDAILAHCRRAGQRVYLPSFDAHTGAYGFCEWPEGAAMAPGPLGIPQPAASLPVDVAALDFIVVPGVAFDAYGGRVGHGGGHYDRMLAQAAHAFRASVCFDEQVVERCPMGDADVRMDVVVTPLGVLRVS